MPCTLLKTYNTGIPGKSSVCSLAASTATPAKSPHFSENTLFTAGMYITVFNSMPMKTFVTHRAHLLFGSAQ